MDVTLLEPLVNVSRPWADAYNDSALLQAGVLFTHFAGLLTAGGFAVATDRLALRASREPGPQRLFLLRELGSVHRPVLLGLVVVTVTGIAMALADAEYLLTSAVFWLKMAAFALLLGNGVLMMRAERRLRRGDDEPAAEPDRSTDLLALLSGTGLATAGDATPLPDPDAAVVAAGDGEHDPPEPAPSDREPGRGWSALRWAAVRSIALWGATLLLGTALTVA